MLAQAQMPVSANATGLWPQSCTRTNELDSKQFSCLARSPLGETIFGYAYLKICHMAENKRQRDRGEEREGGDNRENSTTGWLLRCNSANQVLRFYMVTFICICGLFCHIDPKTHLECYALLRKRQADFYLGDRRSWPLGDHNQLELFSPEKCKSAIYFNRKLSGLLLGSRDSYQGVPQFVPGSPLIPKGETGVCVPW